MNIRSLFLIFLLCSFLTHLNAQNIPVKPSETGAGVFLGPTIPLRNIPEISSAEVQLLKSKAEAKQLNAKLRVRQYPYEDVAFPKGPDAVWQKTMGKSAFGNAPEVIFEGQSTSSYPPDCNGTAGPNHYMQLVNTTYAIYDKSGTKLAGPTLLRQLFNGVAGAKCDDGDPIILFDEQADRWFASEFSLCDSTDRMLIAVSTTNDPTGTWNAYSFDVADMPDYPKFSVWQDGYYMGDNNSTGNDIYVFERSKMLNGEPSPKFVGFKNAWRPGSVDGFMCVPPVDNDGAFAPAGSPGLFIAMSDDAFNSGAPDQLWIYELAINWATTSASTFKRVQQLNVSPFDSNFGNTLMNIKQLGTSKELDAIPQVIMNVPQYRNFGTYQTLVCCHSVDVDKTDHAGVRWYELRKTPPETTWTLRQQGTYAPDFHSRWMGSVMLNGYNELGLGYSISDSTLYPGIRYSGQTAVEYNNASGILDLPEGIILNGTLSQTGADRWGDYSQMSVDPFDDSTFWFSSQYVGAGTRKTKIASFKVGKIPPTANFTADNTLACINTTVAFTSQSTGSPTKYSWVFTPKTIAYTNGTDSLSVNPKVIFKAFGNYTVSLTVTSNAGSTTTTKPDYININEANANFTASSTTVVIDTFITFNDASTCGANSWVWNFGEGASPLTANTQGPHTVSYSSVGLKTVSLIVNAVSTETKTGYINVSQGHVTTSVPEYRLKGVSIFPNPANGLFRIGVDKLKYPVMQISISNLSGVVVLTRECKGESEYLFDLSKSPQGTYFVKIKTDKELLISKMVIIN